jgi:RNA polymerase sigma factor (TIGR02999 family)
MPQRSHETEITGLLRRWNVGRDDKALNAALPHLIGDLRRLARGYMARERPNHTLQPTDLVHEAYLRLLGSDIGKINSRSEFFAFAARLMRQILMESARRRATAKRGGEFVMTEIETALAVPEKNHVDPEYLLILYEILDRLGKINRRQRQIAELRCFLGMTLAEIAEILEVSLATVERGWDAARRWLALEVRDSVPEHA